MIATAVIAAAPRVALADKVRALRDPAIYPGPTGAVRAIETHMSWVFLTDRHAYKLKKPVRYDQLDFRSLANRYFYCLEEVRLNRRLAAHVYLDVVPLVVAADRRLRVGAPGRVVDWIVRMRRLPAQFMLDALLARGAATADQMRAVAARLAAFHCAQPRALLDPSAYRALLLQRIADNEVVLSDPAWSLPGAGVAALCRRQRAAIAAHAGSLDARVAEGRIVEGHGDLRPEHVYLGKPLAIIDCLEFSLELRLLDGIDEVGFLALECERLRARGLGGVLLQAYREDSGDAAPDALVHLYQSCRAMARASLAIGHLREPRYRSSPAWRRRALRYLALAARHLRECDAMPAPAGR